MRDFMDSLGSGIAIAAGALAPRHGGLSPRRLAVLVLFVPLFALVQAIHWLGFLLDEILFRGYRRVPVAAPLFVLGPPRSGTTLVHRVLARDPGLTTFSTWECLFAPSVTQRVFWRGLGALDRRLGAPLGRLRSWLESRLAGGLDAIHPVRLDAPEEDYLALTPILRCFILFLPFPHAERIWQMGFFDRDVPPPEQARVMGFYHRLLQRHLYVHGPDKRLLSKNASFASLVGSLERRYPDARFLCCLRDPLEAVPSQLSSVASGLRLFATDATGVPVRSRMVEVLAFQYENLMGALEPLPDSRRMFVPMTELKRDLGGVVRGAYTRLGLPLAAEFEAALDGEARAARDFRTRHRYTLDGEGIEGAAIRRRFAGYYTRRPVRAAAPGPATDAERA